MIRKDKKTPKFKYTYKELIKMAMAANNRQRRHQVKRIAEDVYPKKFSLRDFSLRRYQHSSYKELCKMYKEETDVMTRCTIKRKAKEYYPEMFQSKNFPRK